MKKRELNQRLFELKNELDKQQEKLLELSNQKEEIDNYKLADKLNMIAEDCQVDRKMLNKISRKIRKGTFDKEDKKLLINILKNNPIDKFLEKRK